MHPLVVSLLLFSLSPLSLAAQTETDTNLDRSFHWKQAFAESLLGDSIANIERFSREEDTRESVQGPFLKNYIRSLENTHGWDDGDALYTSYVLHPMQGSWSNYVERQNDPAFRKVEFGRSQIYWTSIMRSLGFSTLYSVFWSAGPVGEAGLGNVQLHSAPGVVDLVGTEVMGVGWTVGEDAIDRYLIRGIEARVQNSVIRALARSTLNPTRAYANIMRFRSPWYRDSRPLRVGPSDVSALQSPSPAFHPRVWPARHPFELEMNPLAQQFLGRNSGGTCLGAGGEAGVEMTKALSLEVAIEGCRADGRPQNVTDDLFSYLIGPRWTSVNSRRWRQYAELLVGGAKITRVQVDPAKRMELTEAASKLGRPKPGSDEYTTESDTNGFAFAVHSGMSYMWKEGLELRVANLGFQRSFVGRLGDYRYSESLRLSTGIALRLGPWRR